MLVRDQQLKIHAYRGSRFSWRHEPGV